MDNNLLILNNFIIERINNYYPIDSNIKHILSISIINFLNHIQNSIKNKSNIYDFYIDLYKNIYNLCTIKNIILLYVLYNIYKNKQILYDNCYLLYKKTSIYKYYNKLINENNKLPIVKDVAYYIDISNLYTKINTFYEYILLRKQSILYYRSFS
jgi:hypothetical protein